MVEEIAVHVDAVGLREVTRDELSDGGEMEGFVGAAVLDVAELGGGGGWALDHCGAKFWGSGDAAVRCFGGFFGDPLPPYKARAETLVKRTAGLSSLVKYSLLGSVPNGLVQRIKR